MKNGRTLPAPQIAPAPLPPAPSPKAEASAPISVTADRVVLTRPKISLSSHMFVTSTKQASSIEPERAYIAHGVLVIEEMNLWFPLNEIKLGRW